MCATCHSHLNLPDMMQCKLWNYPLHSFIHSLLHSFSRPKYSLGHAVLYFIRCHPYISRANLVFWEPGQLSQYSD